MNDFSHVGRNFLLGAFVMAALLLLVRQSPFRHVTAQGGNNSVVIISAASYASTVAPDSIAAIYRLSGVELATRMEAATPGLPLPSQLAGTTVTIGGQPAPLFYVSADQINCLIPAGLALGRQPVVVRSGNGSTSQGEAQISQAAPGLFTADTSGRGRPVAQLLRVRNGNLIYESVEAAPLDLGPESEPTFLLLYLTGVRRATGNVHVFIGTNDLPGSAAAVSGLAGLDQVSAPLPRNLIGRGRVNVSVAVPGLALSNEVQIDIAGSSGTGAPQISGFEIAEASAGDVAVITGSNFNPERSKNTVRIGGLEASVIEASSGRLRVRVPYGAESSQVSVINERSENDRSEGRSAAVLLIKTSLSGFVEDTRRQPLGNVTVKLRGTPYQGRTTAEGLFSFKDLPNLGNLVEVEIDPTGAVQLGSLPFPKLVIKKSFRTGRDNYIERIPLQQESGPSIQVGMPPTFNPDAPDQGGFARQIATGGVVLDVQPETPAQFPDGASSGRITMTIVADSRTPVALPPSEYSSSVVQLTPFTARLQRGAKLTFPNPERFPAGTQAKLYRLDTLPNQETSFVEVGKAQVSADGQHIESVAGAIDMLSYYFVSLPRRSTAVAGQVVDSDGKTPIRGALVSSRGQTTLTDGTGSFILRSVLVNEGDVIAVEAGYLRPNGRVDRGQIAGIPVVIDGITTLPRPIALTSQDNNRLPIVLAPDSLIISEGEQKDVLLIAAHPDGGQIVDLRLSGANFATLINNGAGLYTLRLTPGPNSLGKYTLRLIATDNFGQTVSPEIALVVNGRPRANPQTLITGQNQPVNFTLTGEDPEGYALAYVIVATPANGRLARLSGLSPDYTYTPNPGFLGSDQMIFKANDALADSPETRVTFLINQINRPPVLTVPGPQTVTVLNPLNFTISASDPDTNQTLAITAINRPGGSDFRQTSNTSAQFSWIPNATQAGSYTVTFEVSDNGTPTYKDTRNVTITVITGSNRPPLANAQSLITNEDTPLNLTLTGNDPDDSPLTYTIVSNPANGTLGGSGATRTYTPNLNFNGTDSFSFKVNDGALDSNTATVTIAVNPVNDAPVLSVPGAQSVNPGQPVSFSVTASDVDAGQTLALTALNAPSGANFTQTSATSGQFTWTPSALQTGSFTVTFRAADNGIPSLSDSKNVAITVNNRAPLANAQSVTTNEDTPLSLTLTGSDPDGSPLTYTIVSNPANGALSGSGAARTYTPNLNFNGTDSFSFKVNDGALDSNTATVAITVNPVNDAPVLSVPGAQSVTAGQTLNFSVTASDVDAGQTLTLTALNAPSGATFTQTSATGGQFTWTPSAAQAGSFTITFRAADNGSPSLTDSKTVNITVSVPANPLPTITSLSPDSANAGGAAFMLTINGTNFVNSSVVRWNDNNRTTTFVRATQLTVQIPASDIATASPASVTVFNPAPGGGMSNTANFIISCAYAIQPTSQAFNAGGGNGTVSVLTANGCMWSAMSNASWLKITNGASGSGPGTVNYLVEENTNTSPRSGMLTIAGQNFAVTQSGSPSGSPIVAVNAASFATNGVVAPESIVSIFGSFQTLNNQLYSAPSIPLPTTLGGVRVAVNGVSAGLNFVATTQINCVIPATLAEGAATVIVTNADGTTRSGNVTIARVAPGIFSARGTGQGTAFGQALRIKGDGSQSLENLANTDGSTRAIDLGPVTDKVYLLLHGTGIRLRSDLSNVKVTIQGVPAQVSLAGQASEPFAGGSFGVGEDQVNVLIPPELSGLGRLNVVVMADNITSNAVTIEIGGTLPSVRVTPISFDQTISGELMVTDQIQVSNSKTYFFDAYRFATTQANTTVAIDLRAIGTSTLDPFVILYRINNGQLIQVGKDDQSGGYGNGVIENNNALLLTVLPTVGDYAIFASSSDAQPDGTGNYTLRLRQNVLQQINYGANLTNAAIASTDIQTSAGTFLDAYWFMAAANDQVDIMMSSTAFDPFLILQANSGGSTIGFDDNGGGGTTARITKQLGTAGIYVVLATPYEKNRIGAYTLKLSKTGPDNPLPTLASLSPNSAAVGSTAFTLTITGANFVNSSVVRWNGSDRATTFVSNTQLTAQIPASDIATASPASVTVFNPAPGGGTSNTANFIISCAYAIQPMSQAFSAGGGNGTVNVTTANGCAWTAMNNASWLTITSGASGSGSGAVNYTVMANASTSSRSGTLTIAGQPFTVTQAGANALATVSAASYSSAEIAVDSQVLSTGTSLATTTLEATVIPLPTTLAGTTVKIRDSAGTERLAPLFRVSPTKVLYHVVQGTATGTATIIVTSGDGTVSVGTTQLVTLAPGLFTADGFEKPFTTNASGQGVAGALVLRIKASGSQTFEAIVRFDEALNKHVAVPIDLGPATDQVYLLLYGTGIRNRSAISAVTASIGGLNLTAAFAGAQGGLPGLDQVNLGPLSRTLAGRGDVDVVLTADGKTSNTVQVNFAGTNNPAPSLTSLSPNAATAGSAAFTLTVNGTNFVNGSSVRWNGSDRATTFVSSAQLRATIPSSDLATAGTASVTVFNPAPGGGGSNTLTFTINQACSYTIQPTSQTFNGAGGTGSVNVTTTSGCTWTATSNASWLTITSGATGNGNGTVNFSAATNTSTSARSGTLTIAGQTFTVTQSGSNQLVIVSGASFSSSVATESVVACFGTNLATSSVQATALPLPTTLAGTTVKVRDSLGTERLAPLFFVSPGQVNLQIPVGTAAGTAIVSLTSGNGTVSATTLSIATVAPSMFAANANGQGAAFGQVLRVKGDGSQLREPLTQFDSGQNRFIAVTINLGPPTDQVFLLLRGTGIRNRNSLSNVTARIGGVDAPVSFAGPATESPYATSVGVGEDQINVLVPRSLTGRGLVDVVITVEGKTANTVQVAIGSAATAQ